MLAAPDILAQAMSLPPSDLETDCDGRYCALSGAAISRGAPVKKVASSATSEFLETFRGDLHGYVSPGAAALFAAANPRARAEFSVMPGKEPEAVSICTSRGYLAIEGGPFYLPLVSSDSAKTKGWASWTDAVRAVWPEHSGRRAVVLITDDFKKRLWPYAQAGPIGPRTPVYLHEGSLYRCSFSLTIDWERMLVRLDELERLYSLGFSKPSLKDNLLSSKAGIEAVGLGEAIRLEQSIMPLRSEPEFQVALVIAQKQEIPECPLQPKLAPVSTPSTEQPSESSPSALDTGSFSQLSLL